MVNKFELYNIKWKDDFLYSDKFLTIYMLTIKNHTNSGRIIGIGLIY